MNPGFIGLLIIVTASSALNGYAKSHGSRRSILKLDLPPVPVAFSPVPYQALSVEPNRLEPKGGLCGKTPGMLFFGCGHSHSMRMVERRSKLPDPVSVLGAAFLKGRAVSLEVLDPRVPVTYYPEGHSGDWVHEGALVTDRIEITDETQVHLIFSLLVEAVSAPEDPFDYVFESTESETTLAEYRRGTGFIPEMIFEFVGPVPLRTEINMSQMRLLVQAGDKWEIYSLDRWSAAALKELSAASVRSGR